MLLSKLRARLGGIANLALIAECIALAFPQFAMAASQWRTKSPNGRNSITITLDGDGVPSYSVSHASQQVVLPSPLGMVSEQGDLSRGLAFTSDSGVVDDRQQYELLTGPISRVDQVLSRRTLTFHSADKLQINVDCVASNEGVAVRLRLGPNSGPTSKILSELTEVRVPRSSTAWLTPYHAAGPHTPNNEDYYFRVAAGDPPIQSRAEAVGWAMPALFQIGSSGPSLLVCESGDVGAFCECHLVSGKVAGSYALALAEKNETHRAPVAFAPFPQITTPKALPWRVLILGDPREIAASTLVTDLAPQSRIADTSWIRPGRASWGWLTQPNGPYHREFFDRFSELASSYGWEYTTFDGGWPDVDLKEIAAFARARRVRPIVWMYSGDCFDAAERRAKLETLKEAGAAGVKVDFWASSLQTPLQAIRGLLEDAARLQLVVLLHGCPVPEGWHRTWPNLLSCEAVLGMEGYIYDDRYAGKVAELNCVLPLTRNVAGPMDATPFRLQPLGPKRLTTAAHELATAIVHSSGVIHFADGPEAYEALPDAVRSIMRDAPARWDQTAFLIANPGVCIVVARRTGKAWYVAGLNGQAEAEPVVVDLKSVGLQSRPFTAITEGDEPATTFQVDHIDGVSRAWRHVIPPRGGFVLRFGTSRARGGSAGQLP